VQLFAILLATASGPVFRTSVVDVTPDEPLPLGGYTARGDKKMEEGGERLFARTLVFQQAEKTIAIVSFEALTVPESLYSAVKGQIPEEVFLLLVATHTHSAPDSQMLNDRMTFRIPGIAPFSRRWLDWYASKIAGGINGALESEAHDAGQTQLAFAEVEANRGRRENAKPPRTATYLALDGKPLLTGYAAHGTLFDEGRTQTSGDWPGACAKGLGGLVIPGPIGDVSPSTVSDDPVENIANMVGKLRSGLLNARVMALFESDRVLASTVEKIALDKPIPHPDFAKSFGAAPPLDQVLIGRFAPPSAFVSIARIGRLVLIGIPGEPTSEIGRKVQVLATSLGFPHSFVVSHTNGWIGYVLTPEDYDRGGYEATLSFHGRDTSNKVVEAVERGLRRLAQPAPRVAHTR
jgi:hypothetical protein